MQTDITVRDSCLVVRMTGQVVPGEWLAGVRTMFDGHMREAAQRGCAGMLYDIRGLVLTLSITDLYDTGVALAAAPNAGIRIACLAREDQVLNDRFFQKVAVNRGVALKVCTTEAEADEWLTGAVV